MRTACRSSVPVIFIFTTSSCPHSFFIFVRGPVVVRLCLVTRVAFSFPGEGNECAPVHTVPEKIYTLGESFQGERALVYRFIRFGRFYFTFHLSFFFCAHGGGVELSCGCVFPNLTRSPVDSVSLSNTVCQEHRMQTKDACVQVIRFWSMFSKFVLRRDVWACVNLPGIGVRDSGEARMCVSVSLNIPVSRLLLRNPSTSPVKMFHFSPGGFD